MAKVGDILESKTSGKFIVIHKDSALDSSLCTVKFIETGYEVTLRHDSMRHRSIKDPYYKSVLNVGYLGHLYEKQGSLTRGINHKIYNKWRTMLWRCYDTTYPDYHCYGGSGVTVCNQWHSFSNFFEDIAKLPGYDEKLIQEGKLELDKDARVPKYSTKIYSKETCSLITPEKNRSLVNYELKYKKCVAVKSGEAILYSSLLECEAKTGIQHRTISAIMLSPKRHRTKGYGFYDPSKFSSIKEILERHANWEKRVPKGKVCIVNTIEGAKRYRSISACSAAIGFSKKAIKKAIANKEALGQYSIELA